MIFLDHLVVAARSLEEGAAWVQARLGVPMGPGGKHAVMGTHNRLLSLGRGRFLEVIAVDPEAPPPSRPRWFSLDAPETLERLEQGPALIHWVVRADDIERAIEAIAPDPPQILSLARGAYRWRIGVPASGSLARDGIVPTVIQWQGAHPSEALGESGCRLERLLLRHREAAHTLGALRDAGLAATDPVEASPQGAGLAARLRTPRGIVDLGE